MICITLLGISAISAADSNQTVTNNDISHISDVSGGVETTNKNYQSDIQSIDAVAVEDTNNQSLNSKNSQKSNSLSASITKNSTKITISSKNVTYGSLITLTATVIDTNTNKYVKSGKVSIKVNGITYGDSINVNNGKASVILNTSKLSSKKYNLTAVYGGNSAYLSSRSGTGYLTIKKAPVTISIPYIKSIVGETVTLKATVVNDNTDTYVNKGTVAFKVSGKTIGKATITNGKASLKYNTSKLSAKNYTVTVVYGETTNYKSSSSSNSLVLVKHGTKVVVNNKTATYGNKFSLDIKVIDIATNTYVKSGKASVKLNGVTIASNVAVSNGIVACKINSNDYKAEKYQITVVYGGDSTYSSSKSTTAYLTIKKAPVKIVTTSLTALVGTSVTLKSKLTSTVDNSSISEGKVSFKVGGITVGTVNVKNGQATFVYDTSHLTNKTYNVTVYYEGSTNFNSKEGKLSLKLIKPSYTFSQIKSAAIELRTYFESNNIVKNVTIAGDNIPIQDLLALMIQAVKNVKNNKGSQSIAYLHFKAPSSQTDTIKAGKYQISEILNFGNISLKYMLQSGSAQSYVTTSLGKLGYYNLIYTYARTMEVCTTTYLVSTTRVYNWAVMHPSNPKTRKIYLTSDVIYSESKDKAFINTLISAFKAKGYTAVYAGYGPNSHNNVIWNSVMPINGVLVPIFGGADAGVIYDMCTRSFMRQKENRMVFVLYNSNTSKDITGLKWLERAHDDNYSPSSFTGIAYPDKYLTSHGYGYIFDNNVNRIVNAVIDYIS